MLCHNPRLGRILVNISKDQVTRRSLFGLNFVESKEQKYVFVKTINAKPLDVYNVVSEVSLYSNFIPYCTESFVNERSLLTKRPSVAGLRVGFQQYDEKFVCDVNCKESQVANKDMYSVEARSLSHSLFDVLYSKWTIVPHPRRPGSAQVELQLRFKFKSALYNSVSSIFAKSVTTLVMNAFERRVFKVVKHQD